MASVSSVPQFNGTMGHSIQTYICHPMTPLFVWQHVCLSLRVLNMFVFPRLALFAFFLYLFVILFACLLAAFFVCCMYMLRARTLGARAWLPRREQKRQGCKQEDASPNRVMFSRLGGLASSCIYFFFPLLATSLKHCIRFITLVSNFRTHS